MSNKYEDLKVRALTAFIGISIISTAYYFFESTGLYVLSAAASVLVGFEAGMMSFKKKSTFLPLLFINSFWFIYFYFQKDLSHLFGVLILSLTAWVWISRFQNLEREEVFNDRANVSSFLFFSLICPTFVIGHLSFENGVEKFAFLLFSVFLFDTLSFFFGKTFGGKFFKTPLYPFASPTKTIEGALFAALTCTLILIFLNPYTKDFSPFARLSTALQLAVIPFYYLLALTGDLVESLLKRSSGTKDSGSFLPGHGGFFDRLDGVLFAGILSYLLLQ